MSIKKILLIPSAIILAAAGWFVYTPAYQLPRDYPPLSKEQRQHMDLKLFNEQSVKGSILPHYTVERRRELILDMAKQGFEIADLAYQLLDIQSGMSGRHWLMPSERAAYHHLRHLADRGDPSAQCLAALVIARWDLDMRNYERYVVQAANAGQPYCTNILSGLLTIHIGQKGPMPTPYWQTIPKNDLKGRELKLLAAKMGVERARLYIVNGYADGWQGYQLDIGKAKCWLALAEQVDTGEASSEKPNLIWLTQQAQEKGINVTEQYDPKQWCETKLTD